MPHDARPLSTASGGSCEPWRARSRGRRRPVAAALLAHGIEQGTRVGLDGEAAGRITLGAFDLAWFAAVIGAEDVDNAVLQVVPLEHAKLTIARLRVDGEGDRSAPAKRDAVARDEIAELAARQDGVYVLGREGERTEDERKTAVRLRELERLGVVSARAPGQWNIPTNFIEQTRQREAPARYKFSVEPLPLSLEAQVGHRGPVWLDTLEPKALSRAGFGAEVRRALERRRQSLVERGIAPSEGQRGTRLQESERRAIGRNVAQRTGQEFLETIPNGFRGRVQLDPSGAPYLRVSDGTSFVLVRATPQTRALQGKAVEVSCDAHGGFVGLRARDIDRGR